MDIIYCYTDGACSVNNKSSDYSPGGWGWVIYRDGKIIKENFEGEHKTTNSRMEIMAIHNLLTYLLTTNYINIQIFSDNNYCVQTLGCPILSGWISKWLKLSPPFKNKAHPDLWMDIADIVNKLQTRGCNISIKYVPAHSNIEGNERADFLALKGKALYT